jgi:hypothetical protein
LAASNPNSVTKEIAFYICLEHFKLKLAKNIDLEEMFFFLGE